MAGFRHPRPPRSSRLNRTNPIVKIYLFSLTLTSKMKLWTQKLRSLDLKIKTFLTRSWISTPAARQKLSSWEIKDLGEIYFFLFALTPKMKLWTQKMRSLDLKIKPCLTRSWGYVVRSRDIIFWVQRLIFRARANKNI